MNCLAFTSYPWKYVPTNKWYFDNPRTMAPTNKNDSTVHVYILFENFELYFKYFKQAKPMFILSNLNGCLTFLHMLMSSSSDWLSNVSSGRVFIFAPKNLIAFSLTDSSSPNIWLKIPSNEPGQINAKQNMTRWLHIKIYQILDISFFQ